MTRLLSVAALMVATVAGVAYAADLKSGPQTGENIPGPFHPMNITGPDAGKAVCLVCKNGGNPVAMVFARETSPNLSKLVKKIDTLTAENKAAKMGSFVVFCSEDSKLEDSLKAMAKDQNLTNTVLSIDNPAGPESYEIAKDADVTVVLYNKHKVKANYAFKKGEMKETDVEKIVADISKIVPAK